MPSLPKRTAAVLGLALAFLAGCPEARAPAGAPAAQPKRYTVRGEVVRLPDAGAPAPELSIRHEAIPDFEDRAGAVVGMGAMVMPFRVKRGVSLDGLAPGDRIRFRFAVDWSANRIEIESIEELPRETALDFGGPR
jgi:Cu/Ag efflux protein CusF